MSLNQTVKMHTNKYYSDPTHNRTQKNMSSNVFKMGNAFKKLNVEQKNYNIFMQTMKFLCHKLQIGRQEARLTNSEENALNKVALQLEKQFKNANMKFNSTAFKSLFKRTAKSLEESHNLKKKWLVEKWLAEKWLVEILKEVLVKKIMENKWYYMKKMKMKHKW